MRRTLFALAAVVLGGGFVHAEPARDAILADYLARARAADPAFAGFSAARGETLFSAKHGGGAPETPSCTACHGTDPRRPGENVKTKKAIEPMAVSANPKRYTGLAEAEKWFKRNCKQVLGRECTPLEKGDFVTFMTSR